MKRIAPLLIAFAFAACDNSSHQSSDLSDMAVADLSTGSTADLLARPDFSGVNCGKATCKGGAMDVCCVTDYIDMGFAESCTVRTMCPPNATPLACDGPEDCANMAGGCCATISGTGYVDAGMATSGNGVAACAPSCTVSATIDDNGNFSAQTHLCHTGADCVGLMGTISAPGIPTSTQSFTGCCMQAQAGPYTFCAPLAADGVYGVTCPKSIN